MGEWCQTFREGVVCLINKGRNVCRLTFRPLTVGHQAPNIAAPHPTGTKTPCLRNPVHETAKHVHFQSDPFRILNSKRFSLKLNNFVIITLLWTSTIMQARIHVCTMIICLYVRMYVYAMYTVYICTIFYYVCTRCVLYIYVLLCMYYVCIYYLCVCVCMQLC